jgi:hypothetical protein
LHVPKEYAELIAFCVDIGLRQAGFLFAHRPRDEVIKDEVKRGLRILGEKTTVDPSILGNKEKGFQVFKELNLPYPPGIVLSDELVQAILNADRESQLLYLELIGNALATLGSWHSKELYYRSNPRQSMPGILESIPDCDLLNGIKKVAQSWNTSKAKKYRIQKKISHDYKLPIIIQKEIQVSEASIPESFTDADWRMRQYIYFDKQVPVRKGPAGSGVFYTRDPKTGARNLVGRFALYTPGKELMSGRIAGKDISQLSSVDTGVYAELNRAADLLETHLGPQQVEFVFRPDSNGIGRVSFLQTRNMHASFRARLQLASDNVAASGGDLDKQALAMDELQDQFVRILYQVAHPELLQPIAESRFSTPGAFRGRLAFSAETARQYEENGESVIFVVDKQNREEVMDALFEYSNSALVALFGNDSSHEADLTRDAGIPALINLKPANNADITRHGNTLRISMDEHPIVLSEGDWVVIDGDRQILSVGPAEALEEDKSILNVSYGIKTRQLKQSVQKPFLNPDGTLKTSISRQRLEAINRRAEAYKQRMVHGTDKMVGIRATLIKHYLHLLLEMASQGQAGARLGVARHFDNSVFSEIVRRAKMNGELVLSGSEEQVFLQALMLRNDPEMEGRVKALQRIEDKLSCRAYDRLYQIAVGSGTDAIEMAERVQSTFAVSLGTRPIPGFDENLFAQIETRALKDKSIELSQVERDTLLWGLLMLGKPVFERVTRVLDRLGSSERQLLSKRAREWPFPVQQMSYRLTSARLQSERYFTLSDASGYGEEGLVPRPQISSRLKPISVGWRPELRTKYWDRYDGSKIKPKRYTHDDSLMTATIGGPGDVLTQGGALFCNYLILRDRATGKAAIIHNSNEDTNLDSIGWTESVIEKVCEEMGIPINDRKYLEKNVCAYLLRPAKDALNLTQEVERVLGSACTNLGIPQMGSDRNDLWRGALVRVFIDEGLVVSGEWLGYHYLDLNEMEKAEFMMGARLAHEYQKRYLNFDEAVSVDEEVSRLVFCESFLGEKLIVLPHDKQVVNVIDPPTQEVLWRPFMCRD